MIIHYLSASRLKKYMQCTEAYYQSYEKKVRGDAIHLRFGTLMHTVFEKWFQSNEDIKDIFNEEWKKSDVVSPEYYADGLEICELFEQNNDRENSISLGYEIPFAINIEDNIALDVSDVDFSNPKEAKAFLKGLEESDRPYIFGFIDRVEFNAEEDILYIIDYKTSRIPLTRTEADEDVQLSMYALVASYLFPEYDYVRLQLHYVRFGDVVETTRTPEELALFKDWLIGMFYIIKGDSSPVPTINQYCGWCDHRGNCVAYQDIINANAPIDERDVQGLNFEEMDEQLDIIKLQKKILEQREKEIEKLIKEELKRTDNEPILANNKAISVRTNKRVSYDPATVISLFPDHFDKLLSVKKGDVDKLAKGNEEAIEELRVTGHEYYISPTITKKKIDLELSELLQEDE